MRHETPLFGCHVFSVSLGLGKYDNTINLIAKK